MCLSLFIFQWIPILQFLRLNARFILCDSLNTRLSILVVHLEQGQQRCLDSDDCEAPICWEYLQNIPYCYMCVILERTPCVQESLDISLKIVYVDFRMPKTACLPSWCLFLNM